MTDRRLSTNTFASLVDWMREDMKWRKLIQSSQEHFTYFNTLNFKPNPTRMELTVKCKQYTNSKGVKVVGVIFLHNGKLVYDNDGNVLHKVYDHYMLALDGVLPDFGYKLQQIFNCNPVLHFRYEELEFTL
jgi:hypothetical protein